MKQTKDYIEELLQRFFDGQTTEVEELLLSDYFHDAESAPEEWEVYKEMFESFKSDAYDFSQEELDAMLTPTGKERPKVVRLLPWVSVACVAALMGMFVWHPWVETPVSDVLSIAQVKPVEGVTKMNSAETEFTTSKHYEKRIAPLQKDRENKFIRPAKQTAPPDNSQEITTSELLETIKLLVDVGNENITITSLPDNDGFAVRTVSYEGESNSYTLRRCAESSSLELKSQVINF